MKIQYSGLQQSQKDLDVLIGYHEKRNKQVLDSLMEDPQISQLIQYAHYLLNNHYEKTINQQEDGYYCMDIYNEEFIASKLYGLELHKLKEFFIKADDYINEKVFIVMTFKILSCQAEESPFVLNGVRQLFNTILLSKQNNWQSITDQLDQELYLKVPMIRFEDFLSNYMNMSIYNEDKQSRGQDLDNQKNAYSIVEPKSQNKTLHKNDIRKVIFGRSISQIAVSEDGLDEIMLFDINFQPTHHLKFKESKDSKTVFILDFNYSESQKEFAATLQDHSITFWSNSDQFLKVRIISSTKMHLKIYYIELLHSWVTINSQNNLIIWKDNQEHEIKPKIENSQIQTLFEIPSKKIICLQTDNKKIHLFNYEFTQKLLTISDIFIFQQVAFNILTQSFYSTNFSHQLQKWSLEQTSTDYTREDKYNVCKQEYSILAFAFISNDSLLVTFDSSYLVKLYDPKTFQQLTSLKKLIKKSSNMQFIELSHFKIALLGQRVNIFQIIKKDQQLELKQSLVENTLTDQPMNSHEIMLEKTKQILNTLTKKIPKQFRKLSIIQSDKAEKLSELLQHKKTLILKDFPPPIQQQEKQQFPETQLASVYLQELEQQSFFRKLNKANKKASNEQIEKIRQNQGDPGGRINKMQLNDSLRKMLNTFQKIDGKLLDEPKNIKFSPLKDNQQEVHKPTTLKKIDRLQRLACQHESIYSSRTDYINYYNFQPEAITSHRNLFTKQEDESISLTKSQRNAAKKVIIKSLQKNPRLNENKKRQFSEILQNQSKITINTEQSALAKIWVNNKFKMLQKHAQEQSNLLPRNLDLSQADTVISSRQLDATKINKFEKRVRQVSQVNSKNQFNLSEHGLENLQNTRKYMEQVKLAIQFIETENSYRGLHIT